jgi:hypothetical protein
VIPKRFDLSPIIAPIIDNRHLIVQTSSITTYVVFLEWFENQLMPALKNTSLVVLDNASYHNVKTEDTVCPNFSKKKAVLQNYLTTCMQNNQTFVFTRGYLGALNPSFGSHI